MNYLFCFVTVFLVLGVVCLGVVVVPYYGVIALMVISFFCCVFMVVLGRTFSALVMYVVYLGGLIVVFGYCVCVEKGGAMFFTWHIPSWVVFVLVMFSILLWVGVYGVGGLLVYVGLEDLVGLEVNGVGVFYMGGGAGLIVCSWGLLVVLFSILIILGWTRFGSMRSF